MNARSKFEATLPGIAKEPVTLFDDESNGGILFITLTYEERAMLENLASSAAAKTGRPVTFTEIVRRLIADAGAV